MKATPGLAVRSASIALRAKPWLQGVHLARLPRPDCRRE
jgi:hypothetical protein